MTDLTDNEIEEILDCLAEQGIDYVMSKKDMKELLKKNAKNQIHLKIYLKKMSKFQRQLMSKIQRLLL